MKRPNWIHMLACGSPGLEHFRELIAAADAGRAPAPETVRALADASRHLFADGKARDRLEAFGRELGMLEKKGKGRKPDDSAGAFARELGAVGLVIQAEKRMTAEGMTKSKVEALAIAETAARMRLSDKTVKRWVMVHRETAMEELAKIEAGEYFWTR